MKTDRQAPFLRWWEGERPRARGAGPGGVPGAPKHLFAGAHRLLACGDAKKKKKKSLPQMAWKSSNSASSTCVKAWSSQKVNFERKQLFGQEVLLEKMLKTEEAGGLLLSPYL